ncbi:MAG: sulfurtransferase [Bacteroidota bacterium]
MSKPIVSVEWLATHIHEPSLIVLDSSPVSNVSGISSSHADACIPSSRLFDLKEKFTDKSSPFPNTIPTPERFEEECQKLGIDKSSKIVVYDNLGNYTSPRVWWLFKVMGHEQVFVLNGGLPEWIKQGHPTGKKSDLSNDFSRGDFQSRYNSEFVISYADVIENNHAGAFRIVDARSEGRFTGSDPEPRKYLQSGCIPNSVNIPWKSLLTDEKFKSKEELESIFDHKLVGSSKLVFSCGSGLTACIVMLAHEIARGENLSLFDGSWTEYAERQNLRVKDG